MQKNDFIRITYSGKIKETDQEFDKGDNTPVVVGQNFVIKGIDAALLEMSVNDKKSIEILPENGFGKRNPKLIKLVPLSEFKKHNTNPYPGMVINADNLQGRVLSVGSGRVRLDFNHPLAGKTLIYDLEIKEKIEDKKEKIISLVEYYTKLPKNKIDVNILEKQVEIITPPGVSPVYKKKVADNVREIIGIEKTKFSEIFDKPEEAKEEKKK